MSRIVGPNRRRLGVRAQSTAIAALVAALALLLGSAVMLAMLHQSNNKSMYEAAASRAQLVARAVTDGGIGNVRSDDLLPGGEVDVIQVLDDRGNLLVGTSGLSRAAVVEAGYEPGAHEYLDDVSVPGGTEQYCAAVLYAAHGDEHYIVVALVRAGGIRHSETVTAAILLVELPIIVVIAALATYLLVGRSLRPVSRITTQVTEITATALGRRVPVPAANDEIRTLATTMNDMLVRLEHSHDVQTQFIGDASHELRSPLTTLVGILDLADDTDSTIDLGTVRSTLQPEARRMQRMVDDLLLLARADENGIRLHPDSVDLDDLVIAEVTRLRAMGLVRVRSRIAAVQITADPDMVSRALRNLTDNAVRHARSMVWLEIARSDGFAVFTVSDDGPGIAADQRSRIFDRFSRLDVDRREAVGAGLGLAIVTEIARSHHGYVEVSDSEHGGAAFRLALPLNPESADGTSGEDGPPDAVGLPVSRQTSQSM